MANGVLKIMDGSQKTYVKYMYTYGGETYTNIHTFTTGGRTAQSIAPAISETKVSLASLNPASVKADKVIAKTNACMYDYDKDQFYGFYYQGEGYPMYFNQYRYTSVPDNHEMYTTHNYWPSFLCEKKMVQRQSVGLKVRRLCVQHYRTVSVSSQACIHLFLISSVF